MNRNPQFAHVHNIALDKRKRGMKAMHRGVIMKVRCHGSCACASAHYTKTRAATTLRSNATRPWQSGMLDNACMGGKQMHASLMCAPSSSPTAQVPNRQLCQNVLNAHRLKGAGSAPAAMGASTVSELRAMFNNLNLKTLRDSGQGSSVEPGRHYNTCTVGIIGTPTVSDDCKTVNFVLSSEFQLSRNLDGATIMGGLQKGSDFTHNVTTENLRAGGCGVCSMQSQVSEASEITTFAFVTPTAHPC
jgi:hypothetical protein